MSFIPRSRGDTFVKREWLLSDRIDNYFSRVVEMFILHFDSSGFLFSRRGMIELFKIFKNFFFLRKKIPFEFTNEGKDLSYKFHFQ